MGALGTTTPPRPAIVARILSMNDQLNWQDEDTPSAMPAPSAAVDLEGGSQNPAASHGQAARQDFGAREGAAIDTPGGAAADGEVPAHFRNSEDTWPPPGDAVYTTDEARLYLYDKHDVFLRERHVQKLVTDQQKLHGKRVPKDGGGSVLEITRSSLDRYVHDHPEKQNARDVALDPNDKLFNHFRNIAGRKGYKYIIEGAAPAKSEPPARALETPRADPAPAPAETAGPTPNEAAAPPPALDTVPTALYEKALERIDNLEQVSMKLYDTLDSTYDKMADMGMELMALTKAVTAKLESPATILDSMTSTIKAANKIDDDRPLPTHIEHRRDHQPDTDPRWQRPGN